MTEVSFWGELSQITRLSHVLEDVETADSTQCTENVNYYIADMQWCNVNL